MSEKHVTCTCPPGTCEKCKCQDNKVYSGIHLLETGDNLNIPEGVDVEEYLNNLETKSEIKS